MKQLLIGLDGLVLALLWASMLFPAIAVLDYEFTGEARVFRFLECRPGLEIAIQILVAGLLTAWLGCGGARSSIWRLFPLRALPLSDTIFARRVLTILLIIVAWVRLFVLAPGLWNGHAFG